MPSIWQIFKEVFLEDRKGEKPVSIDLADVAPIWLKFNRDFTPEPMSGDEPESLSAEMDIESPVTDAPGAPPARGGNGTSTPEYMPVPEPKPTPALAPVIESSIFYKDIVEPYKDYFVAQKAMAGVSQMIELLDRYGGCPSVVNMDEDEERQDIATLADVLRQVNLKSHSYRVVRILLDLAKTTYRDFEHIVPKATVAALGHDLGKIPEIRMSPAYAKGDHPTVSAAKVAEIFSDADLFWLTPTLDAIKNHHRATQDQFAQLLKRADGMAREIEVAEVTRELQRKEWAEWFQPTDLLGKVTPHVNIVQTANKWKAFSFRSVVYCQPDFLFELTKEMAYEKRVMDIMLYRSSDKETAMKKIVQSIREAGLLGEEIGMGFIGRYYDVALDGPTTKRGKPWFMTPIKIEAVGTASDLESRKQGYLSLIRNVSPAKKR